MGDPVSARYKDALRRGHVAVVKGRPREAIKHYEEAGRLAEKRPLPFLQMGTVYLQMRQPGEALAAYEEALKRAPGDLDAMRGKVMALEADGKRREGADLRQHIAELEAMARISQGRNAPGRAADHRLLELERHVAAAAEARARGQADVALVAYLAAANGYAAVNDFDAAMDACLRALEIHPGHIDVHFLMAVLYLRRGWTEQGVARLVLISHRLDVDDDPRRRAALQALARDHRTLAPELERIGTTGS